MSGNSSDAQDDDGPQLQAKKIPEFSLLRCALEEFANEKASMEPSTAELFQVLETRIPWLATEEGVQYQVCAVVLSCTSSLSFRVQNSLWQTLTTCPLFQHSESESAKNLAIYHWSYHPPTPPTPSPLLSSLSSLSSSLPPSSTNMRPSQHTLQTLTDFTGYLTTQVYSFPFHIPGGSHLSPAEEELRREIRALKGLVLNRCVFASILF